MKNLTGTARWSDGTETVTVDCLTSPPMADTRRQTIKAVHKDPRTGFGSIAQTLQQAQARDPSISRQEVKAFLAGLWVNPQRGYNSFVPMNQGQALPLYAGGHDALTKKVAAEPLNPTTAPSLRGSLRS